MNRFLKLPLPMLAPASDGEGAAQVVDSIINNDPPAGQEGISSGGIAELPKDDDVDLEVDLGEGTPAAAEDPEYEDLDFEDIKIKAPKGMSQRVKEGLLRQEDYSRNIQQAKKLQGDYESRMKSLQTRTEIDDKISEGTFHLKSMDTELQKEDNYFRSPEWLQLQQDDPIAAQQRWNRFQQNERTRGQLASALGVLGRQRESLVEAASKADAEEVAKRREQLPREIGKLVPGWTPELQGKAKEFALSLGYTPEALDSITDPVHYQTLHFARIGKLYVDAQAKKQRANPTKPAPVTKIVGAGGATAVVDPSKEAPDAYRQRYLREQAQKKAGKK